MKKDNNFNILRVCLSLTVVFYHIGVLNHISFLSHSPGNLAVLSFFVVSGFLITQSYLRNNDLKSYFKARLIRIYPLYFIVILTSFIVGYFISDFKFIEYFNSGGGEYLLANFAFMNFIQPNLPDVFTTNGNYGVVNGSLWSIKVEVMFYISVPIIYGLFTRLFPKEKITLILAALSVIFYYVMSYVINNYGFNHSYNNQLPSYLCFFMAGAWMSFWTKEQRKVIYLLPFSVIYLCSNVNVYFIDVIAVSILVYTLLFLFPKISVPKNIGDISYGIYIWHFPIIQLYISIGVFSNVKHGIFMTVATVLIMSYFSWHLIEKRLVKKREPRIF